MQSVNTKAHCKINLIYIQVQFTYTTNKHAATFSKRQSFSYTDWAQYAVSIIMASGNICVPPIIIYIDGSTLMAIRLLQVWAQWPWTLSPVLFHNELSLFSLFMTYFPWAQHCPQLNASVLDRLPSSTHRKDRCSVSQIRFSGSEPRVVWSCWRSFPVWWRLVNRSSNCMVMVFTRSTES